MTEIVVELADPEPPIVVTLAEVGLVGPPGQSAYQAAVAAGFVGSEEEWLESLGGGGGGAGTVVSVNEIGPDVDGDITLTAGDVDADPAGSAAAAAAASQPLDSDLTAIAALTTTSFGRALLALADAAAGRTAFGLGTAATQSSAAFDAAGAAAAAQAASQPLDADLTALSALTTTAYGRGLLELANQGALMALLANASDTAAGKVELATVAEAQAGVDTSRAVTPAGAAAIITQLIGAAPADLNEWAELVAAIEASEDDVDGILTALTNKQPLDATLTALAGLATAADKVIYATGSDTFATADLTAFGRSVIGAADAAAGRTALGLGTASTHAHGDYDPAGSAAAAAAASQPVDSDLTAIAALTTTSYGRALLELANAGAGRTALGLGTAAVEAATSFQPVDTDLTSIAALTTTAYGRAFLELANQAALVALLPASSTTVQGIVELATSAETTTGTDSDRAVTPAGLKAVTDTLAPKQESVNANPATGSTETIPDPVTGASLNRFVLDSATCAFTLPTPGAGKSFSASLVQDATGGRLATWIGTVKWPGGTPPVLSTGANKIDVVAFACYDGATWLGFFAGANFS